MAQAQRNAAQYTKILTAVLHDQLYRNSMFLVLSRLLNAASGFIFWIIAARFYTVAEVGTATALISSLGLVMLLSRFGFDLSLVRFAADSDQNKAFSTSVVITTAASVVLSVVYLFFARLFQTDLSLGLFNAGLFILITFCNSIALISGNQFLAQRKGQYFFVQTVIFSFRLILLPLLAQFHNFGILLAQGFCYALSALFSLWAIGKGGKLDLCSLDKPFIKQSIRFSIQSYLSTLLTEAPILLLPIMVLHFLGEENAAQYYIAMAIGNLTLIVPNALSFSLFVEGSHGQPVKRNILKAGALGYLFLIPVTVVIVVWGKDILGLLSKEYVAAYRLLIFITAASFFAVIYMIYLSVQNINLRVDRNIKFNLLRFLLLIGAGLLLIPQYGIEGVGFVWLVTHVFLTLLIAVIYAVKHFKKDIGHRNMPITAPITVPITAPIAVSLTTGPVVRDFTAKSLVIVLLNTTACDHEMTITVYDLMEARKIMVEDSALVESNMSRSFLLPKPPTYYEVYIKRVPPGVFAWTSTSTSSYQVNKFGESNTFRHKDFIEIPDP